MTGYEQQTTGSALAPSCQSYPRRGDFAGARDITTLRRPATRQWPRLAAITPDTGFIVTALRLHKYM